MRPIIMSHICKCQGRLRPVTIRAVVLLLITRRKGYRGVGGLTDSLLGKQFRVYFWQMSLHVAGQTQPVLLIYELFFYLILGTPHVSETLHY